MTARAPCAPGRAFLFTSPSGPAILPRSSRGACAIHRPCADCQVRDQSLCGSLSDEELRSLNAIGRHRKLERGQTLLWAGDEALLCANLLSGVLKLSAATADGREQIVGLLYPADFVGRPFAESAEHTITALTDAQLCVFPRKPFEETLEEHVRMERLLLRRTLAALDDARNRMLLLGRKTAEEKVASFLLDMSVHLAPGEERGGRAVTFDLPLTRAQIADVLGDGGQLLLNQLRGQVHAVQQRDTVDQVVGVLEGSFAERADVGLREPALHAAHHRGDLDDRQEHQQAQRDDPALVGTHDGAQRMRHHQPDERDRPGRGGEPGQREGARARVQQRDAEHQQSERRDRHQQQAHLMDDLAAGHLAGVL